MTPATATTESTARLLEDFSQVRRQSEELCCPLSPEDMMVQSCAEASPAKWHLAHTTWFFETFLLQEFLAGYREFNPDFRWLFNSYYNSVSDQPEKKLRASFSRPPVETILSYRRHVEEGIQRLLASNPPEEADAEDRAGGEPRAAASGVAGHRHQARVVDQPASSGLRRRSQSTSARLLPGKRIGFGYEGGLFDIGFAGDGFAFDNELPRHPVYLRPFELASRLVSCAEYLAFIDDGGYRRPELWLAAGWDTVKAEGWKAPLYWRQQDGAWLVYTMYGEQPLTELLQTPVCHVSYFEADAFANWAGKRLPTEAEWEVAAQALPVTGNLLERERCIHWRWAGPARVGRRRCLGMYGSGPRVLTSVTRVFAPVPGALGEYNGKFMSNQMVLRGGSVVTPASHIRATYRNFFSPATRWQFSGIRLANI